MKLEIRIRQKIIQMGRRHIFVFCRDKLETEFKLVKIKIEGKLRVKNKFEF